MLLTDKITEDDNLKERFVMKIEGANSLFIDKKIKQNSNVETSTQSLAQDYGVKELLISEKEMAEAVKTANSRLESYNRKIEFSIHEKTGDIMIKVIDSNTNEVIREIPPEKIKDMIANMLERAGLLVDERA